MHILHSRHGGVSLIATLCLVTASCSQTEETKLNSVKGKVNYEGAGLAGALVSFHLEGVTGVEYTNSTGFTTADGSFSLVTGPKEGAPPGKYVVTIICPTPLKTKEEGMSFGGEPETEDRLQGKYANKAASQINFEIKEGPNQLEPIELK